MHFCALTREQFFSAQKKVFLSYVAKTGSCAHEQIFVRTPAKFRVHSSKKIKRRFSKTTSDFFQKNVVRG